jgi:hypothetical protein
MIERDRGMALRSLPQPTQLAAIAATISNPRTVRRDDIDNPELSPSYLVQLEEIAGKHTDKWKNLAS